MSGLAQLLLGLWPIGCVFCDLGLAHWMFGLDVVGILPTWCFWCFDIFSYLKLRGEEIG